MALSTRSKSKKQSNGDDYSPQSSGEVANNVNAANSTIQNTQQATPAHDTTQPPPSKKRKTTMARTRDDKKVKKDTLKTATDAKVAKPKITLKLHVAPKVDEKPVPQEAPLNTSAPPNLEGEGGIFSNVNAKIAPKLQIPPRSEPDQSRRSRWQDKQIMKVLQEQVLQDMESSEAAHAKEGPVYGTYADDTDSIGTLSPGGYNLPDEPSPVRDREADLAENMGALPREFQALTNPFTDHPAPQMRFATRTYGPHITNPYANRQLNFGIHPVDQPGAEQDLFTIGNGREVLSSQDFGAANNATGGDHLTRSVSQPRMAKGRGTSQIQGIDQVDGPVSNNQYVMSPQSSFGKTTYFLMKRPVDGLGSRSISMPTFDPPVTPSNKGPVTTSDGIRPYRYPSYHKAIRGDKIDPQLLLEDDIRFGRAPKPISKIWYTPSHFRRVPKELAPGELDHNDDTSPTYFMSSDQPSLIRVTGFMVEQGDPEETENGGDGDDNGEETGQHDSDATIEEDVEETGQHNSDATIEEDVEKTGQHDSDATIEEDVGPALNSPRFL